MVEFYKRKLMEKLKKWIDRKEIYAIKGPRQSGKTTLLKILRNWLIEGKEVSPDHTIFLTFEDRELLESFEKAPRELIESYIEDERRYYFFLDEFQYVEEGGQKLKYLYDTLDDVKFVITGSSSLELTSKTSKHLVGRIFSFKLFPFSFWEFLNAKNERLKRVYEKKSKLISDFIRKGKEFQVEKDIFVSDLRKHLHQFLRYGGYPEVVKTQEVETRKVILKNIYETYTTRDIIELLRVKDVSKLRRLITLLSTQLGGMLNYNELGDSCGLYYKKLKKFLKILQETFIIDIIRPYHKNLRTELKKNPKVYFVDLGMRNYAIDNYLPLRKRGDKGEMVENFVLNQLKRSNIGELHYWRTTGKAEVDFVLTMKDQAIPIEVKYKSFENEKTTRSFKSYLSAYGPDRALVLTKDFWGEEEIGKTKVKFAPVCYL